MGWRVQERAEEGGSLQVDILGRGCIHFGGGGGAKQEGTGEG